MLFLYVFWLGMPLKALSEAWEHFVLYKSDFQELFFLELYGFSDSSHFDQLGNKKRPSHVSVLKFGQSKKKRIEILSSEVVKFLPDLSYEVPS